MSKCTGEDTGDNSGNTGGDNGGNTTQPETYNTPAPEYLKTVVYGKSCRMDGWGDLSQYTIAIYSYDRFGVEHAEANCKVDKLLFWRSGVNKI